MAMKNRENDERKNGWIANDFSFVMVFRRKESGSSSKTILNRLVSVITLQVK